ncbi:MAG: hypothetical protein GY758_16130 [Fuerstiella sp.]|nr:hypothetical protein [Fuerstiella sp.]
MSHTHLNSLESPQSPASGDHARPPTLPEQPAAQSFPEQFLSSFFQEKNIKWMLVVGAAIVFGSSLMLVTKNWPSWTSELKYLTILGYTVATFLVAEVCRWRLNLTATYKVLHLLTLLLLPISFYSLTWLSSGTAAMSALLVCATVFLWQASSRILDHLLRGRQTTFLISFQLLCIAGALPHVSTPMAAFAFMMLCWAVFTAGVVKVNRHTFWLAEEHQMPRVFGFLPIAILGLQFLILIGTKAITSIPAQWTGMGCVMVSATVLMTARTVADVFRQRTGNLVRPLPWHIVVPMFCGLVLTALGLVISFSGFSYVGATTYAVIPTAAVSASLMWTAARDTKHSGFVWASLLCALIAYQCAPTLFANIVQQLKAGAASAISEERLPLAFYGLTYLPLLAAVATGSRWFDRRSEFALSRPMKHFVSVISGLLFCAAFTHPKALFLVSLINVASFIGYAILFVDRRYVVPAISALMLATGSAIPALNGMGITSISSDYGFVLLSGLAVALTLTKLLDDLLNRIPVAPGSLVRHRNMLTGKLTKHSALLQRRDGSDRGLCQLAGCILATALSGQWLGQAIYQFWTPLSDAQLLQYGMLMTAFALYTIRNPHYLSGLSIWLMLGFAAARTAAGLNVTFDVLIAGASFATVGLSVAGYLLLKYGGLMEGLNSFSELRQRLGIKTTENLPATEEVRNSRGWTRQAQAFVVPLCDLSLVVLSCLATFIHLPFLVLIHFGTASSLLTFDSALIMTATSITVLWLAAATVALKSRSAGFATTVALPLWASAAGIWSGMPITVEWMPVLWTTVLATIYVAVNAYRQGNALPSNAAGSSINSIQTSVESVPSSHSVPVYSVISRVSESLLQAILILGCLTFALPLRLAAFLILTTFFFVDRRRLDTSRVSFLAVATNIHVLLVASALSGCNGLIVSILNSATPAGAMALVFLTTAISVALFDSERKWLDPIVARTWTGLLRAGLIVMVAVAMFSGIYSFTELTIMVAGFVVIIWAEFRQAIQKRKEAHVWSSIGVCGAAMIFLFSQDLVQLGAGVIQVVLLAIAVMGLVIAKLTDTYVNLAIAKRPMDAIGQTLPTVVALMTIVCELTGTTGTDTATNALSLMMAAGIYFQQAMLTHKRRFAVMAATIMNAGLMLLWRSLDLTAPEFYLVPVGLSVLGLVEMLKKELPTNSHDPLRYIGALTILVSPMFEVLGGSWAHMLSLMVLSVVVILLSIGLRLRALVYAGSAFLAADLVAMVVRTTVSHPGLLWVCGIALGGGVIALAAFCENHREKLLARIRLVSAELATWG